MKINDLDRIAVLNDVPEEGLRAGDEGTVVHVYHDGLAIVVEFTEDPYELHLADLTPDQVRVVWSAAEPVGMAASGT